VLKDRLYTFRADSVERRSAQTVIAEVVYSLTRLMAPILSFTAEDIWAFLPRGLAAEESVFLSFMPEPRPEWENAGLVGHWDKLLEVRSEVQKELEIRRKSGDIGSSLDAKVLLSANDELLALLKEHADELNGLFIVSQTVIVAQAPAGASESAILPGLKIAVVKAEGAKCERCWNYSVHTGENPAYPGACERCVATLDPAKG
jgi:isoleucyl-tRNA synthetase